MSTTSTDSKTGNVTNSEAGGVAAAFEQEARRLVDEFGVPGVALGLLTPDGDHFVSLGVTNLEHPLPVTEDTIFQIGSTTKTLTSLVCSVLEAQGKLALGDLIRTHLPDFKLKDETVAAELTLRDVLTHQGGFQGDLFEDTGEGDDAVAKVLELLARSPQVVPLRGHWSYNNAGFFVAGRVIEVVTGKTFETAVTELVLKPLGMDRTFFFPNEIMTYRYATGYNQVGGEMVVQRPWLMMRSAAPAGSTCSSTIRDLTRYAHYLMSGAMPEAAPEAMPETMPETVPPETKAEVDEAATDAPAKAQDEPAAPSPLGTLEREGLWRPVRSVGGALNGFPGDEGQIGQSWFVDAYPDATIISHGGTTLGHQSDFWVSPDRKVGFISLTNASNGHALNRKLSEWVKRELLGLEKPELPEHPLGEAELEVFAGDYEVVGQEYKLAVRREGDALVLKVPDTASGGTRDLALRFIRPTHAVVVGGDADGIGAEFLLDAGGVAFLRFGARLYPFMRETAASAVPPVEAL